MHPPILKRLPALFACTALALAVGGCPAADDPAPPPVAAPHAARPAAVDALARRVAERTMQMDFDRWDWDSGVAMYGLMTAWRATGERSYRDFVQSWVDGFIARGLPPITHPNHAAPGLALLMIYEDTGQAKYLDAAQMLAEFLVALAPRSHEGALVHNEDQLWVDTLFMSVPFLARFSRVTGDPRYAEEAVKQYLLHARHLQDARTGLFFHGWDESADDHVSGAFWARGNGWAIATAAELLDLLPAEHAARPKIRDAFTRQAAGLARLQDSSGLWHTVVDQSDFYLETSGAAAIAYALFRGLDQGTLDAAGVGSMALRAWEGVAAKAARDGTVLDVSAGTGVAPAVDVYNHMAHDAIQPYGQGLVLLLLTVTASAEDLTRMATVSLRVTGSVSTPHLDRLGRSDDDQPAVTRLVSGLGRDWQPTQAGDGRLAFVSDRSGNEQHPAVSPDGRTMVYVSDASGNSEIYVIELRSADPRPNLNLAADRVPSWSPDGREILFCSESQGNSDIFTIPSGVVPDPSGTQSESLRRLTDDPAADGWPAYSPDGQWIVFQSNRAGSNDIYVMDREGDQVTPIITDPADDVTPAWSPEGRDILFASDRGGDYDIYRVAFSPPVARTLYPNHPLADRIWEAVERLAAAYPPSKMFTGYAADAGGPSADNARRNVDAACHDFPDMPNHFGPGAHHRACYEWTAADLALFHAARARRFGWGDDVAWAQAYLDVAMDDLTAFVYGPEDRAGGESYRDSLAGIWQNPLRAVSIVLAADLLRQHDALGTERQMRAEELLSGIARAWYAEFWQTGNHPTTDASLTTRTALDLPAFSLAGKQVTSSTPWTFSWNADKGNSPAEEAAWLGAGAMLASRALADRLPDAGDIYAAGRHYVDFALTYDRPDPVHGRLVRTLNSETTGGAYGQRRYWMENHSADTPSIPYVGSTWHFLDTALFASDLGDQQPWPSLVPDDGQWTVLLRSAGETLRAADGTFLVDFKAGGGIGFNLDRFPDWWTPCGQAQAGRQYVRYDGRSGGAPLYVSEIGHAAGMDMIATGWPIMRIAADRGDQVTYANWDDRLNRVLEEYIARPPNPGWAVCKTAAYVSANPGYHWTRTVGTYVIAALGASGYELGIWGE